MSRAAIMSGRNVILVVDDNPEVLRCCTSILGSAGFRVQVAGDGEEGLECFHRHRGELCLILTDIVMPKMNGLELALAICTIDPAVPILLISGYSDAVLEEDGRKTFPFIRKPFLASGLIQKVHEVLGAPRTKVGR